MACSSIDAQFHAQLQLRANSVMYPRFVVVIHNVCMCFPCAFHFVIVVYQLVFVILCLCTLYSAW